MVNRVSTPMQYAIGQNSMKRGSAKLLQLGEQMSSGKRIVRASVDPAAAGISSDHSQRLMQSTQFIRNGNFMESQLKYQEDYITTFIDRTRRVRELSIQSLSGTSNVVDLGLIAEELKGLCNELSNLANATDETLFLAVTRATPDLFTATTTTSNKLPHTTATWGSGKCWCQPSAASAPPAMVQPCS